MFPAILAEKYQSLPERKSPYRWTKYYYCFFLGSATDERKL